MVTNERAGGGVQLLPSFSIDSVTFISEFLIEEKPYYAIIMSLPLSSAFQVFSVIFFVACH